MLARLAQARRTDRHRIAVRLLASFDPQRETVAPGACRSRAPRADSRSRRRRSRDPRRRRGARGPAARSRSVSRPPPRSRWPRRPRQQRTPRSQDRLRRARVAGRFAAGALIAVDLPDVAAVDAERSRGRRRRGLDRRSGRAASRSRLRGSRTPPVRGVRRGLSVDRVAAQREPQQALAPPSIRGSTSFSGTASTAVARCCVVVLLVLLAALEVRAVREHADVLRSTRACVSAIALVARVEQHVDAVIGLDESAEPDTPSTFTAIAGSRADPAGDRPGGRKSREQRLALPDRLIDLAPDYVVDLLERALRNQRHGLEGERLGLDGLPLLDRRDRDHHARELARVGDLGHLRQPAQVADQSQREAVPDTTPPRSSRSPDSAPSRSAWVLPLARPGRASRRPARRRRSGSGGSCRAARA